MISPSPFSFRSFRLFWLARLATVLAQSCTVLAIGWQVYDLSRLTMGVKAAALRLGLIGLAQFLPLLFATLISGWVADRIDRRRVAGAALALHFTCAVALGALVWVEWRDLAAYYAIAAGLGVVRAFFMPAMTAIAPNLVPRDVLPRAVAASAVAGRMGAIVGPMLGGFAYAFAPSSPFMLSALMLLIAFTCVALLPAIDSHVGGLRRSVLSELVAGIRYVRDNRILLGVVSLDLFAVLLGGVTALLPVFARDILNVGPTGLGWLRSAPAVGALAAAFVFTLRPLRSSVGTTMLVSVAIFGVAIAGFGLSRWLPLSLALLVIMGGSDMVSVYIRQSMVQLTTPDSMRGRVGSISTLSVSASNELGELESGLSAALLGPVAAVVTGGLCALGIAVMWDRLFPELRAFKKFEHAQVDEP